MSDPLNQYYTVTSFSPTTQVWAGTLGEFRALPDAGYTAWLANDDSNVTQVVPDVTTLNAVLNKLCLRIPRAPILAITTPSPHLATPVPIRVDYQNAYAPNEIFLPQANLPTSLYLGGEGVIIKNLSGTDLNIKSYDGTVTYFVLKDGYTVRCIPVSNNTKNGNWVFFYESTLDPRDAANLATGTLPTARLPAHTGDATSSAGSAALSVVKINGVGLGTTTATSGNILIADGTNWVTKAMSGDATLASSGAITLAAAAVTSANGKASAVVPHYTRASGRYYTTLHPAQTNTFACAANVAYFYPFFVSETTTFDRIACQVQTAGTAANMRLGIFNATNGIPATLVLDAGTTAIAGTGLKTTTISQSLSPGSYFLAVTMDGTNTLYAVSNAASSPVIMGFTDIGAPDTQLTATFTFGAYTSVTFGSGGWGAATYAASNIPILALRKQ